MSTLNMQSRLDQLKERRLERMRMGNQTCEIVPLLSDPEFRVALVPLLEREYDECMRSVALMDIPDNIPGSSLKDRHEKREVLVRAIREPEPGKMALRIFATADEMMEALQPEDINHLYDEYIMMTMTISPHIAQLTEEQIDFLKEVWQTVQWNGLSGRQLYALNRFILTLSQTQLLGNLHGFSSTS